MMCSILPQTYVQITPVVYSLQAVFQELHKSKGDLGQVLLSLMITTTETKSGQTRSYRQQAKHCDGGH
jgi:hypothetical protein